MIDCGGARCPGQAHVLLPGNSRRCICDSCGTMVGSSGFQNLCPSCPITWQILTYYCLRWTNQSFVVRRGHVIMICVLFAHLRKVRSPITFREMYGNTLVMIDISYLLYP
jgi:hypothetical protein